MTKSVWTSKTFWFNILLKLSGVLALFFPQIQVFLSAHPSAILILIGVVGNLLRFVTKGAVTLTDDSIPAAKV